MKLQCLDNVGAMNFLENLLIWSIENGNLINICFYWEYELYRLAYPVWMLENIMSTYSSPGTQVYVMYDITCSTFKYLQVRLQLQFTEVSIYLYITFSLLEELIYLIT